MARRTTEAFSWTCAHRQTELMNDAPGAWGAGGGHAAAPLASLPRQHQHPNKVLLCLCCGIDRHLGGIKAHIPATPLYLLQHRQLPLQCLDAQLRCIQALGQALTLVLQGRRKHQE